VKKWIDYKSLSIYGSATKRKIKFCVMKFAYIFLMDKLNPQNFF